MKMFRGFSHFLAFAIIFFSIGARKFALAEEECSGHQHSNKLFDQTFGLGLTGDDFFTSMMSPWAVRDYFRPWRHLASLTKDYGSTINTDKNQFQVNLDVQHFAPDEISVKTVDGYVVIEAKHEEKQDDHGFISRQFVRKYSLPEGTEAEDVISQLSSDGILTISAPRKVVPGKGERIVPITQTGPVRKESKESDSKEDLHGTCDADKCEKK